MSPEEMEQAREAAFATYPSDGPVTRRVLAQATQQEARAARADKHRFHRAQAARWPSDEERTADWPSPTQEEMPELLRGLKPRTWQLLLFWLYWEGVSAAEVADRLGYTRGRVSQLVPLALVALKEMHKK